MSALQPEKHFFRILFFFLLTLHCESVVAQKEAPRFEIFNAKNSKLPHNFVNDLAVENGNILWVATNKGVLRLVDGDSILIDKLPGGTGMKAVRSICVDSVRGYKYFGSFNQGVFRILESDRMHFGAVKDAEVRKLSVPGNGKPEKNHNVISLQVSPSGEVLIGTEEGGLFAASPDFSELEVIENKKFKRVFSIKSTGKGSFHVATETGLYVMDKNKSIKPFGSYRDIVNAVCFDYKGRLWVSMTDKSSSVLLHNDSEIKPDREVPMIFRDLIEDDEENLWGASMLRGLVCFDGKSWRSYNPENSEFPGFSVSCLAKDRSGNLWVGTFGNGLVRASLHEEKPSEESTAEESPAEEISSSSVRIGDKKLQIGEALDLKIQFHRGSAVFTDTKPLESLTRFMQANPKAEIELAGHTDNIGNPQMNRILSLNRAKAVRDYLGGRGISQRRIQIRGYGGEKPAFSNQSEEGKVKNRRVEVKVLKIK